MTIRTSSRLDKIQPSMTLAITAKAIKMRAEGIDVVSFSAGEPDFDTPAHIKDAARKGLDTGVAKYTAVNGLASLRQAIAQETEKVHGVRFSPEQVVVSTGAKQCLYNLFHALLDDGDEVIVPGPYWVSYPDMVKLAGGEPVFVPTTADSGFQMSAEQLRAAITPRTRAVVLNTPSNPTGGIYSRETLSALAKVVAENDILVVSDDIYRSLVYGGAEYSSIVRVAPEIASKMVLIDGVSKTYAMTGWRIGWAVGPTEVIKAMTKVQSQSTSNASHIGQVAAQAALTGPQDCVAEMRAAFDERRKKIVSLLRAIPGVTCIEPLGAFYAFPDFSHYLGKKTPAGGTIDSDIALADFLIDHKVAVVPGSGFGAPGYLRLSYACAMKDIETGLARIADAVATLRD